MFARMALWGWTALGTYLVALNLLVYLRADTGKKQGIGLLFLIFFSGMDILGALYSSDCRTCWPMTLCTWNGGRMISSSAP